MDIAPGSTILTKGEAMTCAYVILSGEANVIRYAEVRSVASQLARSGDKPAAQPRTPRTILRGNRSQQTVALKIATLAESELFGEFSRDDQHT